MAALSLCSAILKVVKTPPLWRPAVCKLSSIGHFSSIKLVSRKTLHVDATMRNKVAEDNPALNEPVKYSTSDAHGHNPYETFSGPAPRFPWYQPWSIIASVSVLLIYFCILREENDIDDELNRTIFEKVPGLEYQDVKAKINRAKKKKVPGLEYQDVKAKINRAKMQGVPTHELEQKLKNIKSR